MVRDGITVIFGPVQDLCGVFLECYGLIMAQGYKVL